MIKKKKKSSDAFFLTFVGEYVQILTNMSTTQTLQDEAGVVEETRPIVFEGYLLDADDDYYYLGNSAEEVCRAVKKDCVTALEIPREESVMDQIIDSVEPPQNKKDYN